MTSKTGMNYGDPNATFVQAAGLLSLAQKRDGLINRLTAKLPSGTSDAMSKTKGQSGLHMPIMQTQDLGRGKGDQVEFHCMQPVNSFPIMGKDIAQGKGVGMSYVKDHVKVDQVRFPVDLGDMMSQIRTPYDLRAIGRPVAQSLMNRYMDQAPIVHLAGARGFHTARGFNGWTIPTPDHPDFAKIAINRVKAPTKNRHMMAAGNYVDMFGVNAGEIDITTDDILTMDVVDAIDSFMSQIEYPMPDVMFDGDTAAGDRPLKVLLCSDAQYNSFAKHEKFRSLQANALARASSANNHPIFKVDAGLWSNTLIIRNPIPIRFYKGDTIKYCASYDSETESSCVVPDSFGDNFAVDRAILLGGQALVHAFGATGNGIPFFWNEEQGDHKDKVELLIGAVMGYSKARFELKDDQTGQTQFTDLGVTVIDTAVPIIGARK